MILTDILTPILNIVDRVIPDPQKRDQIKLEMEKLQQEDRFKQLELILSSDTSQNAVNLEEAKHENLFVSGARPFILWVCGIALAYHYILQPFLAFILYASGHEVNLPVFNMASLDTILMGLLGLGGLRSLDKIKGVK